MVKLLIATLLTLTAANAMADNIFIYEDKAQQTLLNNTNPSSNLDKFTKKVKVIYYVDNDDYAHKSKRSESKQKQAVSQEQRVSYGTSNSVNSSSSSYSNSSYAALR